MLLPHDPCRGRKQVDIKDKIRWQGYDEAHDIWEPHSHLLTYESQIQICIYGYRAYRGLDPPPDFWCR
jgi:hypothetical protein